MNTSHFLFTFDLPLSPKMTEQKEERGVKKKERGKVGGEESQTEGGGKKGKKRREGEEKLGGVREGGQLLLLLSPYLLSLSLYFFSFCLSKGKLGGQSFATSSLQLVPHQPSSFFGSKMTSPETTQT